MILCGKFVLTLISILLGMQQGNMKYSYTLSMNGTVVQKKNTVHKHGFLGSLIPGDKNVISQPLTASVSIRVVIRYGKKLFYFFRVTPPPLNAANQLKNEIGKVSA